MKINSLKEYVFWLSHSRGALDTLNALRNVPDHIQERIFVLAVCPAAIIDEKLCTGFTHLVGKDFVPFSDPLGMLLNNKTISFLERAPGQIYTCDHSYISPSYRKSIRRAFLQFVDYVEGNK